VGNSLIYRVKGCVGETPFPQQTSPGRYPSHIQLITCLFLNTPPWSIYHLYIAIKKLLLKNPVGKIKEKHYNNMSSKTPSKIQWEKYKEKPYDICPHLYLYCLIKNLVWEILGKTHKEKKSTISVIGRSSMSYNLGFYSP
jgi:hypothetical protein